MIISIDDPQKREKLRKFAKQALDRAEELKGIKVRNDETTKKTISIQSSSSAARLGTVLANPTIPKHAPKLEVISRESYTMEEKKVLEKTSLINSRIYVPFMEVDLRERFHFPIPFTDKDGMLELAPKQKNEFQEWVRISDLSEHPCIIVGPHADFYSIRQTIVSDCSFVASLSVAAQYEKKFNKRILTSIIYPRNSKDEPVYNPRYHYIVRSLLNSESSNFIFSGKYSIKLHVNGIARKIIVDDYLPVGKHNQLLCSYSSNKSEFWVSLMEKAYMKVFK